jgi:hypothetical protein
MSKQKLLMLVALSLVSASVYAAKERVVRFENRVRFGVDDNVYASDENEVDSLFLSETINLSAKLNFSSRTDLLLYWQPELRFWFDVPGDEVVSYQDFYARLNHAVSQRTFVQVSDRLTLKDAQGQTALDSTENLYVENDLMGSADYTVDSRSHVKVGAGYLLRRWDDSDYGSGDQRNDFDQYSLNGTYIREIYPNRTKGVVGLTYTDHEYDSDRGGHDSVTVFGGVDQNLNPNVTGFGRLGFTTATIEGTVGGDEDTTTPFADFGLEFNPTARTSFNGSLGYSLDFAENSIYNAQERFKLALAFRHDLTAKISFSTALTWIYGQYDASHALADRPDEEELFVSLGLRGSYQINRNNFLDIGYEFSDKSVDEGILSEYTRNRFDIGWRLRL